MTKRSDTTNNSLKFKLVNESRIDRSPQHWRHLSKSGLYGRVLGMLTVLPWLTLVPASLTQANASSLYGSQVTAVVTCCSLGSVSTIPSTQTAGPGVEFPSGSLAGLSGFNIIGVSIDVQQSDIDILFTQTAQAAGGSFNGYVLTFASAPAILSASLDPSSSYNSSQVKVSLMGDNEVLVNNSGLFVTDGSQEIVDLGFSAPEPGSWALMAGALPLILIASRRAKLRMIG